MFTWLTVHRPLDIQKVLGDPMGVGASAYRFSGPSEFENWEEKWSDIAWWLEFHIVSLGFFWAKYQITLSMKGRFLSWCTFLLGSQAMMSLVFFVCLAFQQRFQMFPDWQRQKSHQKYIKKSRYAHHSKSPSGGNQVDGSPPTRHTTETFGLPPEGLGPAPIDKSDRRNSKNKKKSDMN